MLIVLLKFQTNPDENLFEFYTCLLSANLLFRLFFFLNVEGTAALNLQLKKHENKQIYGGALWLLFV